MAFIRTILGDIEAATFGVCYAHEHVVIDESFTTEQTPDFLLADVEKILPELAAFRASGGRAMVDSMPGGGAGRNVLKLADVARRSGIHILCPTGLHLAKYYPAGHWSNRASEDELTQLFTDEIELGIDTNDLAGPTIWRSPHRAGLVKVAGGKDRLSDREQRTFIAAARTQLKTGCPILTHTEEGTAALEQVELLKANGADLSHVVLSHTDRKPDISYHREILSTGVKVEYDSCFRWKSGNPTLDLLPFLLTEFPDQIMLGMDAARNKYWKSFGGGPGLDFLLTEFTQRMTQAGISEERLNRVFVRTPAQTFSFINRSSQ